MTICDLTYYDEEPCLLSITQDRSGSYHIQPSTVPLTRLEREIKQSLEGGL